MVESYIVEGRHNIGQHIYGQSITDPCIGWEDTEALLKNICRKTVDIHTGLTYASSIQPAIRRIKSMIITALFFFCRFSVIYIIPNAYTSMYKIS